MKVLITGVNGIVGAALCRMAATQYAGCFQIVEKISTVQQVQQLLYAVNPHCAPAKNIPAYDPYLLAQIETIIHVAETTACQCDRTTDPLNCFRETNAIQTYQLARSAAESGVRRFIYLSSIDVLGEGQLPGPDFNFKTYSELSPPQPRHAYGMSKWEGELLLQYVAKQTGLEVVIIRSPLAYGPGVDGSFLQLMKWIDYGVPLPFKSVKNLRSLIYVDNLADAILHSAIHPSAGGNTFLVSDNIDLSTPRLIRYLGRTLQRSPRLFSVPVPLLQLMGQFPGRSDLMNRLLNTLTVDIGHIARTLDWVPTIPLMHGLQTTARWYHDRPFGNAL